ncbi:MAG: DUF3078 domain-containing protein [Bacteroidales bacterium]|nr:DUF3078 domain-containing protein [Bacteroidales bacterium]
MKKIYSILFITMLFFSVLSVSAQNDTTYWTKAGDFSLNFNQTNFTNWAAGGDNALAGVAMLNYNLDYAKDKKTWKNKLILGYGLQYLSTDYKKTEDKIDFSSLLGHQIKPKWDASMLLFLKTQFVEGFDGDNDSVYVSKFMAPGYFGFGPGFNYKPTDYFSVFLSPATAQLVIVNDQRLADEGAFGVSPAIYDENGVKLRNGELIKFQFGAAVKMHFKKDIAKNINLETTLELFSDYLHNPENIIVNWDVIIDMAVNSWLSAKLTTSLIYDDNITINDKDGNPLGPRTQFKEMFGLGIAVKF